MRYLRADKINYVKTALLAKKPEFAELIEGLDEEIEAEVTTQNEADFFVTCRLSWWRNASTPDEYLAAKAVREANNIAYEQALTEDARAHGFSNYKLMSGGGWDHSNKRSCQATEAVRRGLLRKDVYTFPKAKRERAIREACGNVSEAYLNYCLSLKPAELKARFVKYEEHHIQWGSLRSQVGSEPFGVITGGPATPERIGWLLRSEWKAVESRLGIEWMDV